MPKRRARVPVRAVRVPLTTRGPYAQLFDLAIVGGGIAGLYAAETALRRKPTLNVVLLESAARLGGRAFNVDFEGCSVQTGAGVGRAGKDALLEALLQRHAIPVQPSVSRLQYVRHGVLSDAPGVDQNVLIDRLGRPTAQERTNMNFQQFLEAHLRPSDAKGFCFAAGFDDYLRADIVDALDDYGFSDTLPETRIFSVPWNVLCSRIAEDIAGRGCQIFTGTRVTKLNDYVAGRTIYWHLDTVNKTYPDLKIMAKNVLLALPAAPARALVYKHASERTRNLISQVRGQPFARLYIRVDLEQSRDFTQKITRETVSAGTLRKTIPIDPQRGVYMLAYCDNVHVSRLRRISRIACPTKRHRALERLVGRDLGIHEMKIVRSKFFFWPVGTHYNMPLVGALSRDAFLNAVRHPKERLALCGEAFSRGQGWVEGALQSVHEIFDDQHHKFLFR